MNTNENNSENPLLFWVAYLPGPENKKSYLGDGMGHLRIFKTEDAAHTFLSANMPPELYARVVVHSVQGQIAIPVEPSKKQKPLIGKQTPSEVLKTLAPNTFPTSLEVLQTYERNKRRRRRN